MLLSTVPVFRMECGPSWLMLESQLCVNCLCSVEVIIQSAVFVECGLFAECSFSLWSCNALSYMTIVSLIYHCLLFLTTVFVECYISPSELSCNIRNLLPCLKENTLLRMNVFVLQSLSSLNSVCADNLWTVEMCEVVTWLTDYKI